MLYLLRWMDLNKTVELLLLQLLTDLMFLIQRYFVLEDLIDKLLLIDQM